MDELNDLFGDVRRLVDEQLSRLVPSGPDGPVRLYDAIRWSLFGTGKRFRPALVMAVGREFGAKDERLIKTAAAVEMIHTYSLIHDDLPAMDDDDLRRGRATVHKKYDEATAILAGDALQAMAFQVIASDDHLDERLRLQLVLELSAAAGEMVAGQQLDLEAEGTATDIGSIEEIYRGKTGALIRFAVRAGGLIAGVTDDDLQVLNRFGEKLGLLFQITDDILDLTSTSESLGKTAGKDAASRKATFPEVLGLEGAVKMRNEVSDETIASLVPLGHRSRLLRQICEFVSHRRH